MKEVITSAPGKVHFLGEHAVVYGKPALITTIDRRCTVHLTPTDKQAIEVSSANLNKTVTLSPEELQQKRKEAQIKWEEYRDDGDIAVLKSITADEMDYPLIAIGETLHYFRKDLPSGFNLSIDSDIPIGAGLGSSAATAVSVVAAMTAFLGGPSNREEINDIAFLVEQKRHGFPSGGDNSTVCFGGLVWFRKETPELKIIQPLSFAVPAAFAQNFLIVDSGRPAESTGEMVGHVRSLYQKDPQLVERFLSDQEKLTRELLSALKNGKEAELIAIIKAGERNLQEIGVVSPSASSLIEEIDKAGGAAKICGAGGRTTGSGVILAYHPNRSILQKIATSSRLHHYDAVLGAEGLHVGSEMGKIHPTLPFTKHI